MATLCYFADNDESTHGNRNGYHFATDDFSIRATRGNFGGSVPDSKAVLNVQVF